MLTAQKSSNRTLFSYFFVPFPKQKAAAQFPAMHFGYSAGSPAKLTSF